jgi:beta-glucosidase
MPQATFYFPTGFLWGTATAAHQVEGSNTNNTWSAWEQEPGRIRGGDRAGLACDWWGGRWREDLNRAAETGQNAHRMSIEWSRIQPEPERWDEYALDHYREIVRGIVERGMTPMITLHHFTDPLWLAEQGAWESEKTAGLFATYAQRVVEALKEYVTLWVTINEPNVYAYSGYITADFPPGRRNMDTAFRVMANLVRGHAAAYAAIHTKQREARVGIAQHYRGLVPARSWFPLDGLVAGLQHRLFNHFFPRALTDGTLDFVRSKVRIPEAAHTQDFLGVNYYTRDQVTFSPFHPESGYGKNSYPAGADLSGAGFIANDPEGMFAALRWANGFNVPLIVTENGVEDADDRMRPRYLAQHVHQVWRAINFNWPIKGYFHWSLVDNFEWERGWSQRFGLWGLDRETQARRKRPSVDLYAAICRENGLSADMVSRYAPEVLEKIFPG